MSAPAQAASAMPFRIRLADAADADAVAAIYNQGIAERAATFETVPRTPTELAQRIGEDAARLEGRWLDVVIVERLIPENQP